MPTKTVTVGSSVGLHARPATLIAQAAADTGVTVTIANVGEEEGVDAGSALLIMTLGAKFGDQVVVASEDEVALTKVAALVEQDLDA
jgi:phosphocarrier protein HPr